MAYWKKSAFQNEVNGAGIFGGAAWWDFFVV